MITEQRVQDLVDHFCQEQEVDRYSIKFSNTKATLGTCFFDYPAYSWDGSYDFRNSVVSFQFSRFWMEHSPLEEVMDTILHEIAHAIAGPKAGHGADWKKVARRLGCNPKASSKNTLPDDVKEANYKWRGFCPNGHKHFKNRLTERAKNYSSCNSCDSTYNPLYKIEWEQLR